MVKRVLFLLILFFFLAAVLYAQSGMSSDIKAAPRGDIWAGLAAETSFYNVEGLAHGGSFALGYGTGLSFGIKGALFFSSLGINTLELNFICRYYLRGMNSYSGPFVQVMAGPNLFNRSGEFSLPSYLGSVSAGVCFGWRFIFRNRFFAEPVIRAGYPYILGAGVSAGVRF